MEEILLEVESRQELGKNKVNELRRQGFIPAVVYAEGKEALALKISRHEFLRLIHKHHVENAVLKLKIKDDKKKDPRSCMIKEIQHEPVKGDIIHIDFNEISLTKVLKVNVPVTTSGEPIGVKQEGGSLEHNLWEIEVECLPTDIPKNFEIEVSALKIGDAVHVKDMHFPANIKVLTDAEAVVVSVAAPMKEEVIEAPVEGEEKQEPEVIKEKKEEPAEAAEGEDKEKEKKEKK